MIILVKIDECNEDGTEKYDKINGVRKFKFSVYSFSSLCSVFSMYRFECNQNNFWTIGSCDNGTEGLFLSWLKQDRMKE